MRPQKSLSDFFENTEWPTEMETLREILLTTELEETLKWGMPTYTINGKNVVGLGSFKEHFALWFHQGVFLKDPKGLLINAQTGKTVGLRHMRFTSGKEIKKRIVKQYVLEAIQNQKDGLMIKSKKKVSKVAMPKELEQAFKKTKNLKAFYEALTPGRQKDVCEYIDGAKRQSTRDQRLEKSIELMKEGKSPMDMYR